MSRPANPPAPSAPRPPDAPEDAERTPEAEDRRLAAHLRTLTQLAPGIAHDLRAPVNAMRFNLEVLRAALLRPLTPGEPPRETRLLRYAEILDEELLRLHHGLEVLFAYLRPAAQRREDLTLDAALREIETLLVPTARKRQIGIRREDPEPDLPLPGDGATWRQVLLQVAVLALEGVATQGQLTLSGEKTSRGLRLRIHGTPLLSPSEPPPREDGRLAVALLLLEGGGGTLRKIDNSVSTEPGTTYEVEFPDSRNATAVEKI